MSGFIWKRLFWKEFREGWQVVVVGVMAPLALFPPAFRYGSDSWQRAIFAVPAVAGVHLAVALWAIGRGTSKRQEGEFAGAHLPLSPLPEWTSSLLLPTMVAALLGLWFGGLIGAIGQYGPATVRVALAGALDLVTTYLICYYISAVASNWAALLFAAVRLLGGSIIPASTLEPMLHPDVLNFVGRTALAAAVGSLMLAVMSRKRSVGLRQLASLVVVIVIIFGPSAKELNFLALKPRKENPVLSGGYMDNRYGPLYLSQTYDKSRSRLLKFECYNLRANTHWTRNFQPDTQLLDATQDGRAYFAQQIPKSRGLRILEWDTRTNKLRLAALMPTRGSVLLPAEVYGCHRVSPDGNYLVLMLKSMIGSGYDIWLVDLKSGRSTVAMPSAISQQVDLISWAPGRATISWSGHSTLSIDLKAARARNVDLLEKMPAPAGACAAPGGT